MDRYRAMALTLAAILTLPTVADAGDTPYFTIACPATWPGSDAPDAPLQRGDVYADFVAQLEPAGGGNLPTAPTETAVMDCAYSEYQASPPRHITILVPGHGAKCRLAERGETVEALACDARPEADGTLGPVQMQVAEVVTLDTQLQGIRLRRSQEEIRRQAASTGYAVAEGEHRLRLTRGTEWVEVTFSSVTGLSRLVAAGVPKDKKVEIAPPVIMRFGVFGSLVFTHSPLGWSDRQWTTPGQPAVVRYHPDDGAPTGTLSLIDTATPE